MIAVLWLACRSPETGTGPAPAPAPEQTHVGAATVTPSLLVPTVVTVSFDAASDGVVGVERDGVAAREVPAPAVDGRATATIVGLEAGSTFRLVPRVGEVTGGAATYRTPDVPEGMAVRVTSVDPARSDLASGFLLVALTDLLRSSVAIYDGDGDLVWWVEAEPGWTMSAPRPTRDGRAILLAVNDRERATADQRAIRVALDGSAMTELPTPLAHHMVAELDRGELAWLAWDIREVPWAAGPRDVLSDRLMVGVGDDAEARFSFFDDRGPAYLPCSHGLLRDERLGIEVREWTHGNSVVWIEDTDQLLVVARLIDAVLLVDRESGEVVWQLGGRDATLSYADPAMAFSHGHLSDAWDGGFLLFDNGSHRDPPVSRVVEYRIAGDTAEAVWVYDDPEGRLVEYLGDARRLPSDDVLVAWSPEGSVQEITREGEVVWALATEPDVVAGRVRFLPTLGTEVVP